MFSAILLLVVSAAIPMKKPAVSLVHIFLMGSEKKRTMRASHEGRLSRPGVTGTTHRGLESEAVTSRAMEKRPEIAESGTVMRI